MALNLSKSVAVAVAVLARLLLALTPSYIHPDEHFQGPQPIAALVFRSHLPSTWEFTANRPIRSLASLWPVYAPVAYPFKFILHSNHTGAPLYFALRLWFALLTYLFGINPSSTTLSFRSLTPCPVDCSLPDLLDSPQRLQVARFLLNSSYAFLVYQTHTFSNSIETILVFQLFVLSKKLSRWPHLRTPARFALLGALVAYGIFNRPTFPFWALVPLLSLPLHLSLPDL
jgi:phosphatidylinositol glycan class Z